VGPLRHALKQSCHWLVMVADHVSIRCCFSSLTSLTDWFLINNNMFRCVGFSRCLQAPTCIYSPTGGNPVGISRRCLILIKLEWPRYSVLKKLWRYVKPFRYNWNVTDGPNSYMYSAGTRGRAYSKRAVQPICAVQDAICAVQNEKLCSPKTR